MILISNNMPSVRKTQLEYYAMLAKIKTVPYLGNNTELGSACGKLYRVACMSVIEQGDSDILDKVKE